MRAAALLLLAFAALALVHVSVASGARKQHRKRELAPVGLDTTRESAVDSRRDEDDEEEVKEQGLIPVMETKDEDKETGPRMSPKQSRKIAKKRKRMEKRKQLKERQAKLKAKAKEAKKAKKEMKGKLNKNKKGKKGGKKGNKKGRKAKLNKAMKNRTMCETDADCAEGCCIMRKGHKFCNKPINRAENLRCKRSCQCSAGFDCFVRNSAKARRPAGRVSGHCLSPEGADLSRGYFLPTPTPGA